MRTSRVSSGLVVCGALFVVAGCSDDSGVEKVAGPNAVENVTAAASIVPGVTGGGTVTCVDGDDNEVTVTHGFTLRCDGSPGKMQINWGGNRFVLKSISSRSCGDESGEGAPFATEIEIEGSGKLNGASGALVCAEFDDGEFEGGVDVLALAIIAPGGSIVDCEEFEFTGDVVLVCEDDTPLDSGSHIGH